MTVQYIHDADGTPMFAVLPIDQYRQLLNGQGAIPASATLLSADGRYVSLPHGGSDAKLDVVLLIEFWLTGIRDGDLDEHMAINSRAQVFDRFPAAQQTCTLDPLVRDRFLQSPSYRNTMQVTTEVVDALVATGVFSRCSKLYPDLSFTRSVKALEIDQTKAKAFLEQHAPAKRARS
ncbi:hypothetical protein [Pseudomonas nitroreducens]|uniref:hypothetical protein n=1 Tax=Pseudomonas nitroreducens TaxID=46680 RepID=UPI00147B05C4|nr:hypothetical protein [Pseudomonas nitroreducens]NNN23389.1 hypothetical protein [Pseudomonas nitroreducens]